MVLGRTLKCLSRCFANQMWRFAKIGTQANIDIWFAEINWLQLRMAVSHVHDGYIAIGRQVVKAVSACSCCWLTKRICCSVQIRMQMLLQAFAKIHDGSWT